MGAGHPARGKILAPSVVVFLVEDDEIIRGSLKEALTEGGFGVVLAITGEEAMTMLEAGGENYSALVTDINLPGKVSGWDVAKHAREIKETMPVLYVSGASAHQWAANGVPKSQFIAKPFAIAQVVTAVSTLINAETNAS
jgi:DNA-binding NtrC family response regulator